MLDQLSFTFGRRLPMLLQTEAAECGLACIGMIVSYHGMRFGLHSLRQRFSISSKGTTLHTLAQLAESMGMVARPVKLELDDMRQLRTPCVLHWNFNHFVVLKNSDARGATVHDPAFGIRRLNWKELSDSFTGVALELWPGPRFERASPPPAIKLRQLVGPIVGLYRSLGQLLLLAVGIEAFAITAPLLLQWVADFVLVSSDKELLNLLLIGFSLHLFMHQFTVFFREWLLMIFSTTLKMQWHANAFSHLLRLPLSFFERRYLGDIVSRFGAIETIQKALTTSLLEAILDGVMSVLTLALMFVYSTHLGAIALGAMGLYAIGRWLWFAPLRLAAEEQIVHAAKQQSHFLETMRGIRTIKLFQRQPERQSVWLGLLVDQTNAELRTSKISIVYHAFNGTLFGIEHLAVIWFGAHLVLEQHFTIGMLLAFLAYKGQFDLRVSSLIDKAVELRMLGLQGERLADIVLTPTEVDQGIATPSEVGGELAPSIEVRELRLRYSDADPYVLNGLSLSIAAGECVAIVGPSGCGKTTLLNLLRGLIPVSEGQVLIGGRSLNKLSLNHLRQITASVLQDDALFAGSIADNISFFDRNPDPTLIEHCARLAAIDEEIMAMPTAYSTMIGDMGAALSGGQKQRLLLARALYKQPSILILDEATSHLDLACEERVNQAIAQLRMTRIIAAHRPQTIASADRIIRIVDGKAFEVSRAGEAAPDAPTVTGSPLA
eukprot:TRINITY_DN2999_c0_g1_i9.p1 TRINITY_DN2999_c0_g1~~TRINITY_DN2999_c0_g1_i9.p1  ORF type:complete len:720 (-),score=124.74 TRINITY_DN2999_c0_g1_i9:2621-4780(-)